MKNLYLITTRGLGDFYVLAVDPTRAQEALMFLLVESSYGLPPDRKVISITWISELITGRPNSGDNRLLIATDCNKNDNCYPKEDNK